MEKAVISLAAAQKEKRGPNTRHADQPPGPAKKEGEAKLGAKNLREVKNEKNKHKYCGGWMRHRGNAPSFALF